MDKVKSHTDLEQSKKLAEILKVETADMLHCLDFDRDLLATVPKQYSGSFRHQPELTIPCWSLAALLNVLPHIQEFYPTIAKINDKYVCRYAGSGTWTNGDNPIDACYEMILELHERKML